MSSKLILITGASSGIGAEMAKQFAQQGHTLLLLARNSKKLDDVCSEIKKSGGQSYSCICGVGEYDQVQTVTNAIKESHGTPDVIINNAGSGERLPLAQKLIPIISTEIAARAVVNGVEKGRRDITAPFMVRVILFLNWLTPPITKMIMHATGYKR